jgi:hypothetical protein
MSNAITWKDIQNDCNNIYDLISKREVEKIKQNVNMNKYHGQIKKIDENLIEWFQILPTALHPYLSIFLERRLTLNQIYGYDVTDFICMGIKPFHARKMKNLLLSFELSEQSEDIIGNISTGTIIIREKKSTNKKNKNKWMSLNEKLQRDLMNKQKEHTFLPNEAKNNNGLLLENSSFKKSRNLAIKEKELDEKGENLKQKEDQLVIKENRYLIKHQKLKECFRNVKAKEIEMKEKSKTFDEMKKCIAEKNKERKK